MMNRFYTQYHHFLYSFLIIFIFGYFLCLFLGSIEAFETLVRKLFVSLGNRALSTLLLKTGCSVGLSSTLVFVVRMALLATEGTTFLSNKMMDNHPGWTSIFGTSSGGNSVGSSEASVNQPAPDSPEPVAPEVDQPDGGGPLIPELANHLIPIEERMRELGHRLSINSICKNLTPKEWGSIIAAQAAVEEKVEAALVRDGFNAEAILAKRHQVRGFLFYPGGTSLTEQTYVDYVKSIDNHGTRACVPYKRVIQAIRQHNFSLSWD